MGTRLRQTKLAFETEVGELESWKVGGLESWKGGREWSGGFQPPKAIKEEGLEG